MLRGAFGSALKRTVCAMRLRECDGCPLEHACTYTVVFETRPDPTKGVMTRYDRAPHPFVLVTPIERLREGGGFAAGVRLFGDAVQAAPFVLRAFELAAERGFGSGRVPHRLTAALTEGKEDDRPAWKPGSSFGRPTLLEDPSPLPDTIRLVFRTPLRMKREGRLVTPESLDGPTLVMNAIRRIGLLATFFGRGTDGVDFPRMKAEAERTQLVDAQLSWRDLVRRSSRQNAELGIGGIVGSATLHLSGSAELSRLLAWIPIVHVGKATTMGLGQVEVVP